MLKKENLEVPAVIRDPKVPKGWYLAGSTPYDYEIGIDDQVYYKGRSSGYIKSREAPRGFGTIMQMIKADEHVGRRLQMTGYAKTEQVRGWAGFWMRIDGPDDTQLAFDNMQDRPIKGTCDWASYSVVLDVPVGSVYIAFGVLLTGEGQVWVDEIRFDTVDQDVRTTEPKERGFPERPINLQFEELDAA